MPRVRDTPGITSLAEARGAAIMPGVHLPYMETFTRAGRHKPRPPSKATGTPDPRGSADILSGTVPHPVRGRKSAHTALQHRGRGASTRTMTDDTNFGAASI